MQNQFKRVYLDHAATTPVSEDVINEMNVTWREVFGNPGGHHKEGVEARKMLEDSRKRIAQVLSAVPEEIIFTSGATEANNLAIKGVVDAYKKRFDSKPHVITTEIEHKSVLQPFSELEEMGVDVTYLKPDSDGLIEPKVLREALRDETVLVSVMYASNEIGTVEPLKELARVVKTFKHEGGTNYKEYPYMMSDAAQAPGALPLNVESLGVDLFVLSAQKCYGPKGSGCLYVRRGVSIDPILTGGDQENNLRAGTENIHAIVGFAKALETAESNRESEVTRLTELRDYMIGEIEAIDGLRVNGSLTSRLCGNVNFTLDESINLTGEQLVIELDAVGFAVATGSACRRSSGGGSHVILAIGGNDSDAERTVRISMGQSTNKEDLTRLVGELKEIIERYSSLK